MKKLISITRCFFTVCVPYKPWKTLRKPWKIGTQKATIFSPLVFHRLRPHELRLLKIVFFRSLTLPSTASFPRFNTGQGSPSTGTSVYPMTIARRGNVLLPWQVFRAFFSVFSPAIPRQKSKFTLSISKHYKCWESQAPKVGHAKASRSDLRNQLFDRERLKTRKVDRTQEIKGFNWRGKNLGYSDLDHFTRNLPFLIQERFHRVKMWKAQKMKCDWLAL